MIIIVNIMLFSDSFYIILTAWDSYDADHSNEVDNTLDVVYEDETDN